MRQNRHGVCGTEIKGDEMALTYMGKPVVKQKGLVKARVSSGRQRSGDWEFCISCAEMILIESMTERQRAVLFGREWCGEWECPDCYGNSSVREEPEYKPKKQKPETAEQKRQREINLEKKWKTRVVKAKLKKAINDIRRAVGKKPLKVIGGARWLKKQLKEHQEKYVSSIKETR